MRPPGGLTRILSAGLADLAANQRMFNADPGGADYSKYKAFWSGNQHSEHPMALSDAFLYEVSMCVASLITSILLVVVIYFHLVFGKVRPTNCRGQPRLFEVEVALSLRCAECALREHGEHRRRQPPGENAEPSPRG